MIILVKNIINKIVELGSMTDYKVQVYGDFRILDIDRELTLSLPSGPIYKLNEDGTLYVRADKAGISWMKSRIPSTKNGLCVVISDPLDSIVGFQEVRRIARLKSQNPFKVDNINDSAELKGNYNFWHWLKNRKTFDYFVSLG